MQIGTWNMYVESLFIS